MGATGSGGDRRGLVAMVVTVVLALAGGALLLRATVTPGPPPQPQVTSTAAGTAVPTPSGSRSSVAREAGAPTVSASPSPSASGQTTAKMRSFGPILGPSTPTALTIPAIGVRTRGLVALHVDRQGKLEAPRDFDKAGWYADGPTPGEFGPAVIGAHVDSKSGPAVFYRLGSLRRGAAVLVTREDGTTARFVVDRVERYAKNDFPTATVYGDTKGRAELRLITCGGAFDQATGHYVDNIVAFAHLEA